MREEMKKYNYVLIGIVILCMIAFLWTNPKRLSLKLEGDSVLPSTLISESMEEEQDYNRGIEVPDNWIEEIDDKNSINAVIEVPEKIKKDGFKYAMGKILKVNEMEIVKLLEEDYRLKKTLDNEEIIQYRGADEMYLYFPKENNYGVSLATQLGSYIRMAYREGMTSDYNRDKYRLETELEGFSLEECNERIRQICSAAGIEGEIETIHRALDYQTMADEARELHMDGSVTKPDYLWSVSDNSYYCTISQLCNGVKVIPSYLLTGYGDILNVGSHNCTVNKERIVSFYLDEIYEIQYGEEYLSLLPFSEILQRYKECVTSSLQTYETEVTNITMRVMTIGNEEEKEMVPVWIFLGTWSVEDEETTAPHAVFLNAVTGERL